MSNPGVGSINVHHLLGDIQTAIGPTTNGDVDVPDTIAGTSTDADGNTVEFTLVLAYAS